MANLLMISGDRTLASGKHGAFYNTIEEFHKYWDRVDIICPKSIAKADASVGSPTASRRDRQSRRFSDALGRNSGRLPDRFASGPPTANLFGNVFFHPSPWPLIFQPFWILLKGRRIFNANNYKLETKNYLMTVHEYPPFYNGLGAWLLNIFTKIPYVLEIHHIPGYPRAAGLKERCYRNFFFWFIRFDTARAVGVRVVNKKETPDFLRASGVPAGKIFYIPSAYIDLATFRSLGLAKEYDLVFVGRLEKNKGLDLLLKAASKLKVQIPNFQLLIVGDGSLKKFLKLEIENWKLRNNVLLYGWAKNSAEVAELINKSKVLLVTSYNEGGPRVALEALACGVPIIATPVGIIPDIVQTGEAGEIIDWNANDIAEKVTALLGDAEKYQKYSQNGIEIAKKFEKTAMIKNYADNLKRFL